MHVTQMPKTWTGEMLSLLRIGVPMALAQFIQFFIYGEGLREVHYLPALKEKEYE